MMEGCAGCVASLGVPFVAASMRAFSDVADSFAWLMFRAYISTDDTAEHIQSGRPQRGYRGVVGPPISSYPYILIEPTDLGDIAELLKRQRAH
jgi:hypothetical protein